MIRLPDSLARFAEEFMESNANQSISNFAQEINLQRVRSRLDLVMQVDGGSSEGRARFKDVIRDDQRYLTPEWDFLTL